MLSLRAVISHSYIRIAKVTTKLVIAIGVHWVGARVSYLASGNVTFKTRFVLL